MSKKNKIKNEEILSKIIISLKTNNIKRRLSPYIFSTF